MNITTLNTTTLDGNVIIKKGGGGTPTPPSGGESNIEYIDVSSVADLYPYDMFLYFGLQVKIEAYGAYGEYLGPPLFIWDSIDALYGEARVLAIAVDIKSPIRICFLDANDGIIDFTDWNVIFEMMDLDLSSLPRLTKEEFYAIEKPKMPAYIQHVDGTLYTGGQWTAKGFSNDEANGVAVINERSGVSLVVAKDKFDPMPWSSMPDTLIEGIFTTTDINEKEKEYCGAADTAIIAAADPNSAAAACMNYTFPNGQKGYLMSVDEGYNIYVNESDIRPLMQLLGETWGDDYAWSCVQRDASNAYCVRLAGLIDSYDAAKSSKYVVRPVCTLENYTFAE